MTAEQHSVEPAGEQAELHGFGDYGVVDQRAGARACMVAMNLDTGTISRYKASVSGNGKVDAGMTVVSAMIDEIPKAILERTPQMAEIVEVLDAHREGRTVDARCRVCGTPVTLVEVAATNALLVSCEKGCTRMQAQRAKP